MNEILLDDRMILIRKPNEIFCIPPKPLLGYQRVCARVKETDEEDKLKEPISNMPLSVLTYWPQLEKYTPRTTTSVLIKT